MSDIYLTLFTQLTYIGKEMKTEDQIIAAEVKKYANSLKLRVVDHCNLPNAVNSFMITSGTEFNPTAYIVGGNLRAYIPAGKMDRLCFPTVFKSRRAALDHISTDVWADHCIKSRVDAFEAELRGAY